MVAIKDFEMPKSCNECFFLGYPNCLIKEELFCAEWLGYDIMRHEECPLVEVKVVENGKID